MKKQLHFWKNRIEDKGDIFFPTIFDGNDLKNEMVRLALGKLMPRCDVSNYDRFINGLEDTGILTGMNEKEGWNVHYLNNEMMEMLRKDCKVTDERIKTDSIARWQEENKVFTSSMAGTMTQLASLMVMYRAMQAEPVERPAENPIGKMRKKTFQIMRRENRF